MSKICSCILCHKPLKRNAKNFCSRQCYFKSLKNKIPSQMFGECRGIEWKRAIGNSNKGSRQWQWKGGRHMSKSGYVIISNYDHPKRWPSNKIFEHRIIAEKLIGRMLSPKEVVHHINKIKSDNSSNNLIIFNSDLAHRRFHEDPKNIKEEEIVFDGRNL